MSLFPDSPAAEPAAPLPEVEPIEAAVEPAAVEPAPAEAEAKPEEAPAPQPQPQTVPLAKHIRDRERYQRELSELRQQMAIGQQRLEQLLSTRQAPHVPPPDPQTDPLGATLHKVDQLQANIEQTQGMIAEQRQREAQALQAQQFRAKVLADESSFAAEHADYPKAIEYAKQVKMREYQALGLSPGEAQQRVAMDALAVAASAYQRGESAAEAGYRLAQALGYAASAAPPGAEQIVQQRAAGQALARGGAGGGSAGSKSPTFAELASMSAKDFERLTKGESWERIAGGR